MTKADLIMQFASLAMDIASDILKDLIAGKDIGNKRIKDFSAWRQWERKKIAIDFTELNKEFDKRVPR